MSIYKVVTFSDKSHSANQNLNIYSREYTYNLNLPQGVTYFQDPYLNVSLSTSNFVGESGYNYSVTIYQRGDDGWGRTIKNDSIPLGKTTTFKDLPLDYLNNLQSLSISFYNIKAYKTSVSNMSLSYYYVPYKISQKIITPDSGSLYFRTDTSSDTAMNISVNTNPGYAFDHLDIIDVSTNEIIQTFNSTYVIFDPKVSGGQYIAQLYCKPSEYTVNYYTLLNGVETLIGTQDCLGGQTYDCIPFPDLNIDIPEGYALNPVGWTQETSGVIQNGTDIIYKSSKNLTKITQYTSFTNLGNNGSTVNLYLTLFPIRYSVSFMCYKGNSTEPVADGTYYRVCGEADFTLKNLPSITSGYKLTNQVNPETNLVDSTRVNNWFTSNEHMNPGDETITIIPAAYAGNITLYSREMPIQYIVNYRTLNENGEIINTQKEIYNYGTSYEYLPLPEFDNIPIGYARNPLGWIDSYSASADVDFNSNFMYRYNKTTSDSYKIDQYYGEFSNLKNSDMAEIDLYVGIYPYRYKTTYKTHQQRNGEWYIMSGEDTTPRYYNIDHTLPSAKWEGYISLSRLEELGGAEIKSANTWFISEEHMEPGDEVISDYIYANTLTDNITLYSKIIPIEYTVKYYIIDENGEETLYDTQVCEYGTTYEYLPLPEFDNIPIGYARNPLGWISGYYDAINGAIKYNSDQIYNKQYSYLSGISQYCGNFSNLSKYEGSSVLYYCCIMPIMYSIYYYQYKKGSLSQYNTSTEYRVYGIEKETLRTLPSVTTGYKLTNKMEVTNGPAILTDNYWFTSNEHMNPEDEKIKQIPSTYTDDIYLYSYETPVNYSAIFHTIDENGNELNTENLICYYNQSQTRPNLTSEKEFYELKGWYGDSYNTSDWYINGNTLEFINGVAPNYAFGSSISSQFTTQDQAEFHYYTYYIPYGSVIKYLWLDNYGKDSEDLKIPDKIKKYGEGDYEIETIPSYPGQYIVENEGTKQWYYYENNDTSTEKLINTKTYIEENDFNNYVFYGVKAPMKRHITFSSQNEEFGTVVVLNPTEDELYNEGDIIDVQVFPTEIAYFSNWNDGNNQPIRQIVVGSSNMHYMAIFRSNQVYVGMLGILESYKNISKIKSIIPPNQIAISKNSYTIENPYTYGFYLNNNGYYESNNKKISNSFAMCKVNINAGKAGKMYVDCINYAEGSWDYGMLSKINTTLSADNNVNYNDLHQNFSGLQYSYVQTVEYDIPAGSSFIYIKYKKDGSVDNNNDSLQFKIRFE